MSTLTNQTFDVAIIGAGIHGASLAYEAARAGLKVALFEKGDFGQGASANSLKILHGGLRYLQQVDLPRMRESIVARRFGLTALPHLVRPACFVALTGKGILKSPPAYLAAAIANDVVSFDRNRGVMESRALPFTRAWTPARTRAECPALGAQAGFALCWADSFIENTERYTFAFVRSAVELGATCRNYTPAIRLLQSQGRIEGVVVKDEASDEEIAVRARMTVNAAGSWLPDLLPVADESIAGTKWVRAYNLVTPRSWFGRYGVAIDGNVAGESRNFFFAPWRGGTMIGTIYKPFDPARDEYSLDRKEIEEFVSEINQIYPAADLRTENITFAHVGVLPAKPHKLDQPSGKTRIFDFRKSAGIEGFMAILGVKYTTGPVWAKRLTKKLLRKLGRTPSFTSPGLLCGGERFVDAADVQRAAAGIDEQTASWLATQYGARFTEVIELMRADKALGESIPGSIIPLAVVPHAVRYECARHLVDVVFRRTDLGTFAHPGEAALEVAGATMARECGWTDARRSEEIERVQDHYRMLGLAK